MPISGIGFAITPAFHAVPRIVFRFIAPSVGGVNISLPATADSLRQGHVKSYADHFDSSAITTAIIMQGASFVLLGCCGNTQDGKAIESLTHGRSAQKEPAAIAALLSYAGGF
jgi:hypothetical protein